MERPLPIPDVDRAIAIVGIAGRFPGAGGVAAFWENLIAAREGITRFSDEQLLAAGVDPAVLQDTSYVCANGVLKGIELFDAAFFGMTPLEAEITDPQHRLLLECAWQALEDAGHVPERFDGRIGVFAGTGLSTYLLHNVLTRPDVVERVSPVQLSIANNKDYAPTRISYKLNLKGPSISVNTACSSSLVAVHLACQSLLDYHSDMVIAGGAGIQVPQDVGYHYHSGGITSPDGHCRVFDAKAQGTVSGNGVALVVLRRLSDALADGDAIRAVILGSAVNNDGAAKVGYTAPSVDGQAEVIAEALAVAGVPADSIEYVEAHGTGTAVGDPIEVTALTKAFRLQTDRSGYCALGSVKSSIGHLDEAAGAAGLIKTVLALQHRQIPASLHYEQPNPQIDFAATPFFVNAVTREWTGDAPRRAGVSSFGIGGTNAHVVLQEAPGEVAPEKTAGAQPRQWHVLPVSARTGDALQRVCGDLASYLRVQASTPLADIAWTLQVGRRAFERRCAIVACDREIAVSQLARISDGVLPVTPAIADPRTVFLFPGQGAQYAGMGHGLYEAEPVFRQEIDRCAGVLQRTLGVDVRALIANRDEAVLTATLNAQPALFAIEYALARLWMSWGVMPDMMLGHSLGEYVAATIAGVFTVDDALRLVASRAQLMNALPPGAMLAVPLSEHDLLAMLDPGLSIAAVNAPARTVVSGLSAAIERFEQRLAARGVEGRRLATSHAFHSSAMDAILARFTEQVARVERRAPSLPWFSNITGMPIDAKDAVDPGYWARHLRHAVRFATAAETLLADGRHVFLEVGPGRTLTTLLRVQLGRSERVLAQSLRHPDESGDDRAVMLDGLGRLWSAGVTVDWRAVQQNVPGRRVPLPTYSFSRQRYWIEPGRNTDQRTPPAAKRSAVTDWFYLPAWKRSVAPRGEAPPTRTVVILDADGRSSPLVAALRDAGHDVIEVAHAIDDAAWYAELAQMIAGTQRARVVDCSMFGAGTARAEGEFTHTRHLLRLAQALLPLPGTIELVAIADAAADVSGAEGIDAAKAASAGPLLVLAQERPTITTRLIDATGCGDIRGWQAVAAEISLGADRFVALRHRRRWVQSFDAVPLAPSPPAVPLRTGGAYLITGGLGGVGLILAEHLAGSYGARLALVGRSADAVAAAVAHDTPGAGDPQLQRARGEAIEAAIADASRQLQIRAVDTYPGLRAALADFCASHIVSLLQGSGIAVSPGAALTVDEMARAFRIVAPLRGMCDHFVHVLVDGGVAERNGSGLTFTTRVDALVTPDVARRELVDRFPQFAGTFELLQHCFAHYPAALSGEIPAVSVLYPDGEATLLERAASRTVAHSTRDVYTRALRDVLVKACSEHPHRRVRVLEVGVGDGILASVVAPGLKGLNVEYHATDLGRTFVARAEQLAAGSGLTDIMRFGVLDIARDPAGQGFAPNTFDVVLALDVLHATPDLARTLEHVRNLLVPGGLALIVEAVSPPLWVDFIWGLADGWWGFRDTNRRQHSPLLSRDEWVALCREQGFPHVSGWSDGDYALVMAAAPAGPTHAVRTVRRLIAAGTDVLLLAADVADEEAMRAAVEAAEQRFGRIDGAIHAAGVTARELLVNPIEATSVETAVTVVRPKVTGTHVLARVLRDKALDFILLISSNASVLGGIGLSAYAAASRYLDAFAAAQHARGDDRWVSSNWDGWPTESAGGFESRFQTSIDRYAMSLTECRSAFERVLTAGVPQVIVSAGDLSARVQRWIEAPAATSREAAEPSSDRHARPQMSTSFEAPTSGTEQKLAHLWEELLGLQPVGATDVFAELGGDSLLGTQLIARVERLFGCRMPFRSLYEEPTVRLQARRIDALVAASRPSADRIPRIADRDRYPLSHAQRRLWVLSQLDGSSAYNIPLHQILDGPIDVEALCRALNRLVARHETLRTRFALDNGEPFQEVDGPASAFLRVVDLTVAPDPAQAARAAAQASAAEPFNLTAPPFRASLLRLGPERHVLLFTIHHIACDGVSITVLAKDLAEFYRAERTGASPRLTDLELQYRDYAAWQSERLESGALDHARAHWLRELGAATFAGARAPVPVLELPTDFPRPAVQTFRGRERSWHLPADSARALVSLARARNVSLFMLLSACVKVLLHRYTGQQDLVIGTPVAGRTHPDLEQQVGFYLNMLALRDSVTPELRFVDLLDGVRRTATAAYDHQDYPFDRLVDELSLPRDLSRSPLIDVIVILQNQQESELALDGLQSRPFFEHNGTSKADLTFNFKESPRGLALGIEYNTDLFTDTRIGRMGEHLARVFEQVLVDPAVRIGSLDLMSGSERASVTASNATRHECSQSVTVVDLVRDRAGSTPAGVACECGGERLTYQALHDNVMALANTLTARGVTRGDLVGVYLDRSIQIAPTLLGVLRAGAAYVPLDPTFPPDRLRYMAADAAVRMVITRSSLAAECDQQFNAMRDPSSPRLEILAVPDAPSPAAGRQSVGTLAAPPVPGDTAYVIYTSGSTGKPKGVAVTHQALVNFLCAMRQEPGLSEDDTLLAVTTWSFDISGLELFLPLIAGARLVVATRDETIDGRRLQTRLQTSGATMMQATPATWQLLFEAGWQGSPNLTALCGGEALPRSLAERLVRACRHVWNMYGPTETTIWSSLLDVSHALSTSAPVDAGSVPIGRPIANTALYLLDTGMQPAPLGVPGELYIGGDGVARGYLGAPGLTAERFVPDPFSRMPGARMYRTGDLALRREDGNVQFLARRDDQVKLRGFRVELGEIEDALLKHSAVARVAVLLDGHGADARLLAAVVPHPGQSGNDPAIVADTLRDHLRQWLPEYMVPGAFMLVDDLPRTPNGKIDRHALGALAAGRRRSHTHTAKAPSTPLEHLLCGLWAEVLDVDDMGVDTNFFDLGGHSLKAARLAFRISNATGVAVALTDVFQHPTITELARVVSQRQRPDAAHDPAQDQEIPIAPITAEELDMLQE